MTYLTILEMCNNKVVCIYIYIKKFDLKAMQIKSVWVGFKYSNTNNWLYQNFNHSYSSLNHLV